MAKCEKAGFRERLATSMGIVARSLATDLRDGLALLEQYPEDATFLFPLVAASGNDQLGVPDGIKAFTDRLRGLTDQELCRLFAFSRIGFAQTLVAFLAVTDAVEAVKNDPERN